MVCFIKDILAYYFIFLQFVIKSFHTVSSICRQSQFHHFSDRFTKPMYSIIGERAKRARHSQVCTIENWGYIMVRAISVYSAGVPYAARFTAAVKIPLPLAMYVSVLEFVSIESYLKAISSDYGSNKEY